MNRNEYVITDTRPAQGLIPRGVVGRTFNTGRTEWIVSKGDLVHAHRMHLRAAADYRHQSPASAAMHLTGAAFVRRLLTHRRPVRSTLPILRGKA